MSLTRIKATLFTTLLVIASLQVNAHEIWLERDINGPVRVYLGEPDSGDKIDKLADSQIFTTNRNDIAQGGIMLWLISDQTISQL